jgi:hypothetical protein
MLKFKITQETSVFNQKISCHLLFNFSQGVVSLSLISLAEKHSLICAVAATTKNCNPKNVFSAYFFARDRHSWYKILALGVLAVIMLCEYIPLMIYTFFCVFRESIDGHKTIKLNFIVTFTRTINEISVTMLS